MNKEEFITIVTKTGYAIKKEEQEAMMKNEAYEKSLSDYSY